MLINVSISISQTDCNVKGMQLGCTYGRGNFLGVIEQINCFFFKCSSVGILCTRDVFLIDFVNNNNSLNEFTP